MGWLILCHDFGGSLSGCAREGNENSCAAAVGFDSQSSAHLRDPFPHASQSDASADSQFYLLLLFFRDSAPGISDFEIQAIGSAVSRMVAVGLCECR